VEKVLEWMRETVRQKRILLKPHFFELDPRGEEVLREDEVIGVLHMYGIWPDPVLEHKQAKGRGLALGQLSPDQEALLKRYEVAAPRRSDPMGRDPHVVHSRQFIDYVRLCADLEPKANGRDHDHKERRLQAAWKKPLPPRTKVEMLLERGVRRYEAQLAQAERARRQSMVGGGGEGGGDPDGLAFGAGTQGVTGGAHKGGEHWNIQDLDKPELSSWEVHALHHFLAEAERKLPEAPGGGERVPGRLPRLELGKALEQMNLLGRNFELPVDDPKGAAQGAAQGGRGGDEEPPSPMSPSTTASAARRRSRKGGGSEARRQELYETVFRALELSEQAKETGAEVAAQGSPQPGSPKLPPSGDLSWRGFLNGVVHGVKDGETGLVLLKPLVFYSLSARECQDRAKELFAEATGLQRRVLTGHESSDDVRQIGELTTAATRLSKIAKELRARNAQVGLDEEEDDEKVEVVEVVAEEGAPMIGIRGMMRVAQAAGRFRRTLSMKKDALKEPLSPLSPALSPQKFKADDPEVKQKKKEVRLRRRFKISQEDHAAISAAHAAASS